MLDRMTQASSKAVLMVLNHVLDQHSWAREKLAQFVGRTLKLGLESSNLPKLPFLPPPEIYAKVTELGLLQALGPDDVVGQLSVEMLIKPSAQALEDLRKDGPQGLLKHMRIEGDVLLAACLGEIAQQARWDYEDDLAKVVGDIPARRASLFLQDAKLATQDAIAFAKQRFTGAKEQNAFPLPSQSALEKLDARLSELNSKIANLQAKM